MRTTNNRSKASGAGDQAAIELSKLTSKAELAARLDQRPLTNLVDGFWLWCENQPDPVRTIKLFLGRWGGLGECMTLEEVATRLGISRQRVQQIESVYVERLRNLYGKDAGARSSKLLAHRKSPLFLEKLADEDPWFAGIIDLPVDMTHPLLFLGKMIECLSAKKVHVVDLAGKPALAKIDQKELQALVLDCSRLVRGRPGDRIDVSNAMAFVKSVCARHECPELSEHVFEMIRQELRLFGRDGKYAVPTRGISAEFAVAAVLSESKTPLSLRTLEYRIKRLYGRAWARRYIHNAALKATLLFKGRRYGLRQHLPLSDSDFVQLRTDMEEIISAGSRHKQWHAEELAQRLHTTPRWRSKVLDSYMLSNVLKYSESVRSLRRQIWVRADSTAHDYKDRISVPDACINALRNAGKPLSSKQIAALAFRRRGVGKIFGVPDCSEIIQVDCRLWGLTERDVPISKRRQRQLLDHLERHLRDHSRPIERHEINGIVFSFGMGYLSPTLVTGLARRDLRFRVCKKQRLHLASWKTSPERQAP